MTRKNFATPMNEEIIENFKTKCKQEGHKMNEVMEILMTNYVNGNIEIEKEICHKIHQRRH